MVAAKNPCWPSFSAFHNHPEARRYVRSIWNWTQVGLDLLLDLMTRVLFNFLELDVFKNGVLEGSKLDFGGSRPRSSSLQASIWELQIPAESQNVAKM